MRAERWQCQGSILRGNIERTEAEAAPQRPLSQAQWALRTAFPAVAQWAIERSSKKLYDEDDDMMGGMQGDWMVLNAAGLAGLRTTQADFDRLLAERRA